MERTPTSAPATPPVSTAGRVMFVVGVVVQVLIVYPMATLGLVAPPWAVFALLAVWAALLIVAIRQRNDRPWLALVVPVVTIVIAWAAVAAGGEFLGWQA
jgi:hypothetical protein